VELLRATPLGSLFDTEELQGLADCFVELSYRRGDIVCREGEDGDSFFVVVSGELEVWGGPTRERVVARLGSGEVLGEMALLLGGKRTATVTAARATRLLALDRALFDRMVLPNARVLEYFSRMLCRRLATLVRGDALPAATTVIAVTGRPGLKGKSFVAATLALLLGEYSGREAVLVRGVRDAPRRRRGAPLALREVADRGAEAILATVEPQDGAAPTLTVGLPSRAGGHGGDEIATLVSKLGGRFSFVVLDLGAASDRLAAAVVDSADVAIDILDGRGQARSAADPPALHRTLPVVNLYNGASAPIAISHCEPFVIRDDPALRSLDPPAQARHVRAHPWSPAAPALHRLARKILGATVGLALGGGAAFGVVHVGVLKALEDNEIPIDLLAGSSMGSVVALAYAAGVRAPEMVEIARRLGTKLTTLSAVLDFTLTRPGLLSGDGLVRVFGPLTGAVQHFDELLLPCRAVATDIETGERVTIGSGRIDVAFRASSAVPLLWAPVRLDGRVLVDGGVTDPVPAEVAAEMGADLCIAVNAVPALKRGVDTVLSRLYRRLNRFNPLSYLGESRDMPSMFDLVMNSMQTLQHELGNFKAISADVRIDPDLSAHTWIEFYRPEELMEKGIEATERALPDIRRLIGSRLRAAPGNGAPAGLGHRRSPGAARGDLRWAT
jgi:NTE family protein